MPDTEVAGRLVKQLLLAQPGIVHAGTGTVDRLIYLDH